MDSNARIDLLEKEVANLREHAQRADANLAFMIGMMIELAKDDIRLDALSTIRSVTQPGWNALLVERLAAGREAARQLR